MTTGEFTAYPEVWNSHKNIGKRFTVYPMYRYYTQTASDLFFMPRKRFVQPYQYTPRIMTSRLLTSTNTGFGRYLQGYFYTVQSVEVWLKKALVLGFNQLRKENTGLSCQAYLNWVPSL